MKRKDCDCGGIPEVTFNFKDTIKNESVGSYGIGVKYR